MLIRAGASAGVVRGDASGGLRTLFDAIGVRRSFAEDREDASETSDLHADDFPGRWSRRRAIAPELLPLPRVAAEALEAAGWWKRGSGEVCRGGLVLSNDSQPVLASLDFSREIHARPDALVRPAGFLQSLPSTSTSVLGLLFGLTDYQTCVVSGALSGVQALRHAIDLLSLGRIDRVLVASLSVLGVEKETEPVARAAGPAECRVRMAAALCLESDGREEPVPGRRGPGRELALDCGIVGRPERGTPASAGDEILRDLALELPAEALGLASLPLLLVAKYSEKWFSGADPEPLIYHHEDPLTGGQAWITLRKSCDGSK